MRYWKPVEIILRKQARRLTFEYSLVGGKNDTKEDARGAGAFN